MTFTTPIPFEEAIAKLEARGVLPSNFDSYLWRQVATGVRERAFFSSRVESVRVLSSMKDYLSEYLRVSRYAETSQGPGALVAQGRAEFVADMRELAIREGLGKVDLATGEISPEIDEDDVTDLRSLARLQLIFDTQTEAAQEHGYWKQGQDPDILDVFPAQRFIRVRPVAAPRPLHAANEGAVRRKDDLKFWTSMNADFGVPWGPWGFNSGMGVEDVDREEAEALGLLKRDEAVRPVEREFNEGLQAGVRDMDPALLESLERSTGGKAAGGVLPFRAPDLPLPRGGEEPVPDEVARRMARAMAAEGEIPGDFKDLDMMTPAAARVVRDFEREVATARREHLKAWTPDGAEKWTKVGEVDEVAGPPGGELKGMIVSHNHPTGKPFSIEDLMKLTIWGAAEVRAVAGGIVHVARAGSEEQRNDLATRWRNLNKQAAAVAWEEARKRGDRDDDWLDNATLTGVMVELDHLGIIRYQRLAR